MFVDFELPRGWQGSEYTIYIVEGEGVPDTLSEVWKRELGHSHWDQESFDISVQALRLGVVTWMVLSDGIGCRPVPIRPPAVIRAGEFLHANIKGK